ncbi:MAG: hypothetical protein ACOVKO_03180 [Elstera sp.]
MDLAESEMLDLEQPQGAASPAAADDRDEETEGRSDAVVELKQRFLVYSDQALPQLDSGDSFAFHAQLKADTARPFYALLPPADMPARTDMLEAMRNFNVPGLLKVAEWGKIYWPPEKRHRFAIVLERPGGVRVFPDLKVPQPPLQEEDLITGFLTPLLPAIREFGGRMLSHRAIRPNNIFYADAGRRSMVLGECVSSPPAFDQPAVFEPIESAMAHPTARGNGNNADDLYSLGITMLFLILGRNPVSDLDEERVLANKIEFGSYATLVGQARLPLSLMEPLRGLLTDDPRERWTLQDLDMWLAGRRQSPKQPKLPQRASRPFVFNEVEYFNTRSLANALAKDYINAVTVVRSKQLDAWLRRSLNDEPRAEAMQQAVSSTANHISAGRGSEDRLVARACVPLDPAAPIRYRGFGLNVDGIGPALASAMQHRERRQLIAEVISSRLPIHWISAQAKPRPEDLRAVQLLDRLPTMIDNPSIGYGVERCLYELNPGEHCHSPIFDREYVADLSHIVPALERMARRSNRPESPLDRHIVAFIAARARRMNDDVIKGLQNPDTATRALAVLRLLASVQDQTNSGPAPALAQWLAGMLGGVVGSYHHRKRREKIGERVRRAAMDGQMSELLSVVDDEAERASDTRGFNEAASEYRAIEYQLKQFETEKPRRDDESRHFGEQLAAAIGGLLVSVVTAVTIFATMM